MVKVKKEAGLYLENSEKIKKAQKKHTFIDPECDKLTAEQIINWHPIGGISWDERARRMKEAGIINPENIIKDR